MFVFVVGGGVAHLHREAGGVPEEAVVCPDQHFPRRDPRGILISKDPFLKSVIHVSDS